MLYLKEPVSYNMSDSKAAWVPKAWMLNVEKARLIQGAALVAVAHSDKKGASVHDEVSGAMAVIAEAVTGGMLQGTGVEEQRHNATEKMTKSALIMLLVSLVEQNLEENNWQDKKQKIHHLQTSKHKG